jgi:hypothetical protein
MSLGSLAVLVRPSPFFCFAIFVRLYARRKYAELGTFGLFSWVES